MELGEFKGLLIRLLESGDSDVTRALIKALERDQYALAAAVTRATSLYGRGGT